MKKRKHQLRIGDCHIRWLFVQNSQVLIEPIYSEKNISIDDISSFLEFEKEHFIKTTKGYGVYIKVEYYSGSSNKYPLKYFLIPESIWDNKKTGLIEIKKDKKLQKINLLQETKEKFIKSIQSKIFDLPKILEEMKNDGEVCYNKKIISNPSHEFYSLLKEFEFSNSNGTPADQIVSKIYEGIIKYVESQEDNIREYEVEIELQKELKKIKNQAIQYKERILEKIDELDTTEKFNIDEYKKYVDSLE